MLPEIIAYLLTLRYPGAESGKMGWVCYQGGVQLYLPLVPPGQTVAYTIRPLHGVFAWILYSLKFEPQGVPNTGAGTASQYGASIYSGLMTQRVRDDGFESFILVTEQEPTYVSQINISPLTQGGGIFLTFIVIPSPQDLVTVTDALRRLHTSTESERLQQQAVSILGVLTGQPQEPRPPIGES